MAAKSRAVVFVLVTTLSFLVGAEIHVARLSDGVLVTIRDHGASRRRPMLPRAGSPSACRPG